jgi:hypothetical protein
MQIYYTIHLDENMNVADFNPLVREAYLETVRRTIEVAKQFVALKNQYGRKSQPLILNLQYRENNRKSCLKALTIPIFLSIINRR